MGVGPDDFDRRVNKQPPSSVEPVGSGKSGALLAEWEDGTKAIVKIAKKAFANGKTAQRGIPVCEHPKRELAFVKLAEMYGWGYLVPKVALFRYEGQLASAQAFVVADHLKKFCSGLNSRKNPQWVEALQQACALAAKKHWLRIVVLDIVAGARDRHSNNVGLRILFDGDVAKFQPIAWDNAVTFGKIFHLYHEVFHKYLLRDRFSLTTVWDKLVSLRERDFRSTLASLLDPEEVKHAWLRHCFLVEYPYRLPWVVMSKGSDATNGFPDYLEHFSEHPLENPVQRGGLRYTTPVATQ